MSHIRRRDGVDDDIFELALYPDWVGSYQNSPQAGLRDRYSPPKHSLERTQPQ
jgi:hypothetical protein